MLPSFRWRFGASSGRNGFSFLRSRGLDHRTLNAAFSQPRPLFRALFAGVLLALASTDLPAQIDLTVPSELVVDLSSPGAPGSPRLVQLTESGGALATLPLALPTSFPTAVGLVVLDGELWIATTAGEIARVDLATGSLLDAVPIPGLGCLGAGDECPVDLAVVDGDLLVAANSGRVVRLSPDGTLLSEFDLAFSLGGVTTDGIDLFVIGYPDGLLRRVDFAGTVLETLPPLPTFAPIEPFSIDYSPWDDSIRIVDSLSNAIYVVTLAGTLAEVVPSAALMTLAIETLPAGLPGRFLRGDANSDLSVNLADTIRLLGLLFPAGAPVVPLLCEDAGDANDDGAINLADPVAILASLFGQPLVPLPAPAICGADGGGMAPLDPLTCDDPICP